MTGTINPQEYGGSRWYRRNTPRSDRAFAQVNAGAGVSVTDLGNVATTYTYPQQWNFTAPPAGSSNATYARMWGANRITLNAAQQNSPTPDPTLVGQGVGLTSILTVAFDTDAPTLEGLYYGRGITQTFRLYVNDQLVLDNVAVAGAGNTLSRFKVTFGSGVQYPRRIRVQGLGLIGVTTDKGYTVWQPPAEKVRACFLTDSYGQRGGNDAFQYATAALMGWDLVDANAFGGTGYNNGGGGSYKFIDRVPDVISGGYDHVVLCGGINDVVTNIQTQTQDVIDALRAGLPNVTIWATGPWTPGTSMVSTEQGKHDAIQAACTARGVSFIDNLLWITGSGHVAIGAPASVTATPATTSGTLAAATYYYRVTATDAVGETTGSTEVSTVLSATGQVALAWGSVTGATGYKVYRSTAAGTETFLATSATASYTDTGAAIPGAGIVPSVDTTGVKHDGNADTIISPDGTHPQVPQGPFYIGARLAAGMSSALAI